MKQLLELHYLQNFAPSNLNRDDTGAPKDAIFGGFRRARISSQSYKKAIRDYFNEQIDLIPAEARAIRTKRVFGKLNELLKQKGIPEDHAAVVVERFLGGIGISIDIENDKSQYLLFLGESEIKRLADIMIKYQTEIQQDKGENDKEKKGKKDIKKEAKSAISAEIKKELNSCLDGGKAVDLALFGRMLADLPDKNRDAACQVAHAVSTHVVEREFDYYTAIDDLKPNDNPGADMLGTVEFNSACMYHYLAVDLNQLKKNLLGDMGIFYQGIEAFLRASALAIPSGKQNSFAAFNQPTYYLSTVKTQTGQRNMLNAFEKPVSKKEFRECSLTDASVKRFEHYWEKMDKAFGASGNCTLLNLGDEKSIIADQMDTFEKWVGSTMGKIKQIMES